MASFLGGMGTDWLLKRAFKFMLKRNLGCLLRNEVLDTTLRKYEQMRSRAMSGRCALWTQLMRIQAVQPCRTQLDAGTCSRMNTTCSPCSTTSQAACHHKRSMWGTRCGFVLPDS